MVEEVYSIQQKSEHSGQFQGEVFQTNDLSLKNQKYVDSMECYSVYLYIHLLVKKYDYEKET